MPCLDQLRVTLEMQRSTRFDMSASAEEEYVEKIDLETYIQLMLIVPVLESRAAVLSDLATEVIPDTRATSTPQTTVTDKGKGILCPLPRNSTNKP